jgi:spore coat protein U-like protein
MKRKEVALTLVLAAAGTFGAGTYSDTVVATINF